MTEKKELTGADIRRIRKYCGVGIRELAAMLKYTPQHFSRIEKGRKGHTTSLNHKSVSVPDGIAKPLKRALLICLNKRRQMIEKEDVLN